MWPGWHCFLVDLANRPEGDLELLPMLSSVLILGFLSVAGLGIGIALLSLILYPLQKSTWPAHRKRGLFIALGVLLASPAVAPAGTLAVIPLPLGVLLAFIRSSTDAMFLARTWWFIVPSMLITGFACRYVAHRLFPRGSLVTI